MLRRLVDFYRVQFDLVWHWRRGRRQLLWRAAVSFVVAAFSLSLTVAIVPGVRIDSIYALAAAVIVIGLLSALVRPLLLALVAPLSLALMLVTALAPRLDDQPSEGLLHAFQEQPQRAARAYCQAGEQHL